MLLLLAFGGGFLLFLYYLNDTAGFNRNMYNIYFEGLNKYHSCCIRVEEVVDYYNNLPIDNQPHNVISTPMEPIHENKVIYSYEPYKVEHSLSYYNYAGNANMISISKKPILFLKSYIDNEYKYFQFNDISLNLNSYLPFSTISDDLFMQIEFIFNGKTYDISLNSIKPFLINKNIIFNKRFVKWFMKTQFNIDVKDEDSYSIKIIDASINMLEVKDDEYILFENDSYTVKQEPK